VITIPLEQMIITVCAGGTDARDLLYKLLGEIDRLKLEAKELVKTNERQKAFVEEAMQMAEQARAERERVAEMWQSEVKRNRQMGQALALAGVEVDL
jgi:thioesterase domain-containing protein